MAVLASVWGTPVLKQVAIGYSVQGLAAKVKDTVSKMAVLASVCVVRMYVRTYTCTCVYKSWYTYLDISGWRVVAPEKRGLQFLYHVHLWEHGFLSKPLPQ